jgi:hypothetical protein
MEMTSINNANTEVSEEKAEYGETAEIDDIFKETVDGQDAVEWIKNDTLNSVKRFIAIQRLCEEYGVELTDEQTASIASDVNSLWNDDNYYAQYLYGVDTLGEYYDSIGVGQDSLKDVYTYNDLSDALFLHYYDTDGITPVTDEEFNEYITENYATVKYIELDFTDYQGISLKTDEEIQEVKDKAQSYADRFNGGESIIDIKYEYDLEQAQNEAQVNAEDAYAEETGDDELPDYDTYIQEAIDAATADRAESEDDLDTVISKASSSLDEDLTEFIWNTDADGKAVVYETEYSAYVIIREDITTKTEWKENIKSTVLNALKSDEYEDILKETYADYAVDANDYLVNTKYAPDKIKTFS